MRKREISRNVRHEAFHDENGNNYTVTHTIIVNLLTMNFSSGAESRKETTDHYDLEGGTELIEIDSDTLQSSNGSLVLRRTKPL